MYLFFPFGSFPAFCSVTILSFRLPAGKRTFLACAVLSWPVVFLHCSIVTARIDNGEPAEKAVDVRGSLYALSLFGCWHRRRLSKLN